MTPIEALDALLCRSYPGRLGRPGEVVMRASPEVREALSRLTSDDTRKMRGEDYYNDPARIRR